LNNSIDEISQKLKFVLRESVETHNCASLHAEPAMGGFWCVEPNTDDIESKVNIELLFNAAIKNKELFKKLFIEK
jgi:ABC-2 type transport system ATP-binding protein